MIEILHYATRLESVLRHGRDSTGKVDASRLSRTQKAEVAEILCAAFTAILSQNLIPTLFARIRTHYEIHRDQFSDAEVDRALLFFENFLEFEAKLFESKQIPAVVAKETFDSVNDLKAGLRQFMTDANFRDQLLDPQPYVERLTRTKEIVCNAENAENTELLLEKRFVLGGLAASVANTTVDLLTGAIVLFTVMSTGAGVFVAWRRLNW